MNRRQSDLPLRRSLLALFFMSKAKLVAIRMGLDFQASRYSSRSIYHSVTLAIFALAIWVLGTLLVRGTQVTAVGNVSTTRVSVASNGSQANGHSQFPSISADGRYITFQSEASNLISDDTNNDHDVFIHDKLTSETILISMAPDGTQANDWSGEPAISTDGHYVAFASWANNLVSSDTNTLTDVFVRDRKTNETTLVSVTSNGTQGYGFSDSPFISADGRYVAFESDANLVPNDTYYFDVFVHDRMTGETTRVSIAPDGSQTNGNSNARSISADGRYVTFDSGATNLVTGDTNNVNDVFVHDRITGETTRVSVASDGTQGNNTSHGSSTSNDGRYVAFESYANNLVGNDTNNFLDIFVHDRVNGETTRVSVATDSTQGNYESHWSAISGDGRYVAFVSGASNLVPGDTNDSDVFVYDRETGETTLISVPIDDRQVLGVPYLLSISADGRHVAYGSGASNLVPGDTNNRDDIFVREWQAESQVRYSISGQVIDSSTNCTGDVTVTANSDHSTLTDANGNYTIADLTSGTYMLVASKNSCTFSSPPLVTVPPTATEVNFIATFQSTTGIVKGTVYHIVDNLEQTLVGVHAEVVQESNQTAINTSTNSKGIYQATFQPGVCKVTLRFDGYYTQIKRDINVRPGETTNLTHLLVSENCLPAAASCAVEIAQLLPSIFEVTIPIGLLPTAISMANDFCEVSNRSQAGDVLGALVTTLSLAIEPFEKIPVAGDFLFEPIKTVAACLEDAIYDKLVESCGGYTSCMSEWLAKLAQALRETGRLVVLIHTDNLNQTTRTTSTSEVVQLHMYDSNGNHVGFQDGQYVTQIPNSLFIRFGDEFQIAIITNATDEYNVKVVGQLTAAYQMLVLHPQQGSIVNQVSYGDLDTQPNSVASLNIVSGTTTYDLSVDVNGDAVPDSVTSPREIKRTDLNVTGPSGFELIYRSSSIILDWNRSDHPNVQGYRIYYGHNSRLYNFSIDVGNRTNYQITNMQRGLTYYFAVVSYDASGIESDFSSEQDFHSDFAYYLPIIQRD